MQTLNDVLRNHTIEPETLEKVKAAIAEKFAPAIDFRAPYAKVMLDMAARAVIEVINKDASR